MSIALMWAAQALSSSDLRPSGFYVSGIAQGMTLAEYNSLISNGHYKSSPMGPDSYLAEMDGQSVVVSFCQGRVFSAIAQYRSVDWVLSMKALETAGFKWGAPLLQIDDQRGELRMASVWFGVTTPKGFSYFAAPILKGASAKGRDLPIFQINFETVNHACR